MNLNMLQKIWKTGLVILLVSFLAFGGLFVALPRASATGTPNLTARFLVSDASSAGWAQSVTTSPGRRVAFYVEIHNTTVGTSADGVTARVSLPSGANTFHNIPLTVTAMNANSTSETTQVNITSPAELRYIPGSTEVVWDIDGNGVFEYNNSQVPDGITAGGITLGNQSGCNEFIIQISFVVDVVGQPVVPTPTPTPSPSPSVTPTPTPTPSPSPSVTPTPTPSVTPSPTPVVTPTPTPTPSPVGAGQTQTQTQTQNNNQSVNINLASAPQVAGVKTAVGVPTKQPDTGMNVMGLFTMFSAAPVGLLLSRWGSGRIMSRKEEDDLSKTAHGIASDKKNKLK